MQGVLSLFEHVIRRISCTFTGTIQKTAESAEARRENNTSLRLSATSAVNLFYHDLFIQNKLKSHPKFIYHALHDKPYVVYKGHKRIIDYVEDTVRTFANIVDNFISGEVYNVAGKPEWERDIKEYSDIILNAVGKDDSIVTYEEAEPFTTNIKTIDCSKAIKDLKHDPKVTPEEGIRRTVEWMKWYYRIGD